jgi:hypothetical protein
MRGRQLVLEPGEQLRVAAPAGKSAFGLTKFGRGK